MSTTPEREIISEILFEVSLEREAQIAQWGEQDHPSLYGESDRRQFARAADYWHQVNDARVELDCLSWDGILLEEVYEALSEVDPLLRRMELIQVAAVAAAEIEALDRRIAAGVYDIEIEADLCPVTEQVCEADCETFCAIAEERGEDEDQED